MADIYSNGGNRWNILGFSFTKRDALSSVYKISMVWTSQQIVSASGVLKGLSTRQNTKFKYKTCFKSISLHFNTIVKINPFHENTPPC